jgi:formylglycine-generating enzyme required for sulfatase activity
LDPDPSEAQGLVPIPDIALEPTAGKAVTVPAFAMARYAVSNLEYWEFVTATGHSLPERWNARQDPPFPAHQRHLPVVGVTYRDALAFCFWKSHGTGQLIRLPSAEQWLAAVDGGQGRRFPWGNDFDLQRCNSSVSGWGKRLPVFALRPGASVINPAVPASRIYNLVGNVCEWVSPFEVCGGSWQDDCAKLARQRFRLAVQQSGDFAFRRNDVGFRYVANEMPKDLNP